jgi:hypothetical protein
MANGNVRIWKYKERNGEVKSERGGRTMRGKGM